VHPWRHCKKWWELLLISVKRRWHTSTRRSRGAQRARAARGDLFKLLRKDRASRHADTLITVFITRPRPARPGPGRHRNMSAADNGGYWILATPATTGDSNGKAKLMSDADRTGGAGPPLLPQKGEGRAYPSLLYPMMAASVLFCCLFFTVALGTVMVSPTQGTERQTTRSTLKP
jgi:hypothetical protein